MVATATLDVGLLPLPRFARRVNINTEDEAALAQLLNLTFIEARRVCLERPFQDPGDLLKVRGMSRSTIQQWESGLFSTQICNFLSCSLSIIVCLSLISPHCHP